MGKSHLHLLFTFYLADRVLDAGILEAFHGAVREVLPEWSSTLHVAEDEDDDPNQTVLPHDSLFAAVQKLATPQHSCMPTVWGSHPGVSVYMNGSPSTALPELNRISIEITDLDALEGRPVSNAVQMLADKMVATIPIRYARGCSASEFDATNMVRDASGTRAIGVKLDVSLPGLYWWNFFGAPYLALIGREALQRGAGDTARSTDTGVVVVLSQSPNDWKKESYQQKREELIQAIGSEYFFSRADPDRSTRAPSFGKGN